MGRPCRWWAGCASKGLAIGGRLTMSELGWPCGGWAGHVGLALLVMGWPVGGGLAMSVMGHVACCGLLSAMNLWD